MQAAIHNSDFRQRAFVFYVASPKDLVVSAPTQFRHTVYCPHGGRSGDGASMGRNVAALHEQTGHSARRTSKKIKAFQNGCNNHQTTVTIHMAASVPRSMKAEYKFGFKKK